MPVLDPKALTEQVKPVRSQLEAFESAAEAIRRDPDLSEEGRAKRLKDLAAKATANLDGWDATNVEPLTTQHAALAQTLAAKLAAGAPQPSPVEVQALAAMLTTGPSRPDTVQRVALFAQADDRTRAAMIAASEAIGAIPVQRPDGSFVWESLIDAETVARHREARLREADPEVTRKLHSIEHRRGALRSLSAQARALLRAALR